MSSTTAPNTGARFQENIDRLLDPKKNSEKKKDEDGDKKK